MSSPAEAEGLVPLLYRVRTRRVESAGVVTLGLDALSGPIGEVLPGQFNMLSALGVGEVAISLSGGGAPGELLQHTVRAVGAVSTALCSTEEGALVGVRGPFGNSWGLDTLEGRDVLVVAGGIGLAPLRGAISTLAALGSSRRGRLFVAVGARQPEQVIFADDLGRWRDEGAEVALSVDVAASGWQGRVGLVTALLPLFDFDPENCVALVCGPEVMMRFVARDLISRGLDPAMIRVSLERNMQCALGWCGHCQLGELLICRDGPIFDYASVAGLLHERER